MMNTYLVSVSIRGPEEHLADFANGLRAIYEEHEDLLDHCWSITTGDTAERVEHRLSKVLLGGSLIVAKVEGDILTHEE